MPLFMKYMHVENAILLSKKEKERKKETHKVGVCKFNTNTHIVVPHCSQSIVSRTNPQIPKSMSICI